MGYVIGYDKMKKVLLYHINSEKEDEDENEKDNLRAVGDCHDSDNANRMRNTGYRW